MVIPPQLGETLYATTVTSDRCSDRSVKQVGLAAYTANSRRETSIAAWHDKHERHVADEG
ncbi:MAG TPA: hypothetical protein V6D22_15510 [Candidatus Obscuribacterales bacterium]